MVYSGKPYEQMDDLGVFPLFLETPIYSHGWYRYGIPQGLEANAAETYLRSAVQAEIHEVFFWLGWV